MGELIDSIWADGINGVKNALAKGDDANSVEAGQSALRWAMACSGSQVAELLITHGANIHERDDEGVTTLIEASWSGMASIVRLLIERDLDVNISDQDGFTALMAAAKSGDEEIATLLLNGGASVASTNSQGTTALHIAAIEGDHVGVVRILLEHGASPSSKSRTGHTPVDYATKAWKTRHCGIAQKR